MNVLVVGGAGYVGSHSAKILDGAGHEVWAYDNLCYGHAGAVPAGRLIQGELTDRARRILEMRYAEDMPSRAIAQQLGQNVEAIYKAITRSHRTLAACVTSQLNSVEVPGDG